MKKTPSKKSSKIQQKEWRMYEGSPWHFENLTSLFWIIFTLLLTLWNERRRKISPCWPSLFKFQVKKHNISLRILKLKEFCLYLTLTWWKNSSGNNFFLEKNWVGWDSTNERFQLQTHQKNVIARNCKKKLA